MAFPRLGTFLFSGLLSVALVACAPSMPARMRDEIAKSPPGTATVVFFTDFQCPFCRRTHAALEEAVAQREGKVRVVLAHVPLRSHPDARTAAKASICAEAQGVDLGRALATSPDLSEATCEKLAVKHGANPELVRACLGADATRERLERDEALYEAIEGDGVPILYIGKTRLDGQQSAPALLAAIDRAIAER